MRSHMSDSRQSPIPQDRVNANTNTDERAESDQAQMAEQERYLRDQGVDDRPGGPPDDQPGVSEEPTGPAEGGD